MNKNKWLWILIVGALVFGYQKMQQGQHQGVSDAKQEQTQAQTQNRPGRQSEPRARQGQGSAEQVLRHAFENRLSDIQIQGEGTVVKTLPDDNKGSRHQRFILKISGGQTLLVAHNIDLADKIKGLKKGDKVAFYGEYEWSEQGGVIHWTHHDPAGRHADGWLEHGGRVYQ